MTPPTGTRKKEFVLIFSFNSTVVISSLTRQFMFNSRRNKPKKVTRRHKGGGDQLDPYPLLLTPFVRLATYLAHIMSVLCTFN